MQFPSTGNAFVQLRYCPWSLACEKDLGDSSLVWPTSSLDEKPLLHHCLPDGQEAMKDFLLFFLLGVFSLVLQTTVFYLIPGDFHVDLILILVIYLGFTRDPARGGVLAFLLGYMMDISSGGIKGTFCLSKFVLFLVTATVARRLFRMQPLFIFFLTALFSILDGLMALVIFQIRGTWSVERLNVGNIVFQTMATGVAAPFVFALLHRVDGTLRRFASKEKF
jgi:rod shape-determining protein MreD